MSEPATVAEIVAQVEGDGSPEARLARAIGLAIPPNARFAVREGAADLERLRAEGIHYLVIPRIGAEGIEDRGVTHDRVVLDDDVCTIVSLQPGPIPPAHVPDGLPLPPPEFVGLTMGIFDVPGLYEGFLQSGALDAQSIREALRAGGPGVRRLESILDFGCGCGRILRHWSDLPHTRVHGSDFNPHMVAWCRRSLRFAGFTLNGVAPPLEYDDGSVDLVYAVSVFTHLLEPLQLPWLTELTRIVRPGGRLLLSLNGAQQAEALLDGDRRERFRSGELAQIWAERAGTNACTVFHPAPYRRRLAAAAGLEVLAEHPDAVCNAGQDVLVLRWPG